MLLGASRHGLKNEQSALKIAKLSAEKFASSSTTNTKRAMTASLSRVEPFRRLLSTAAAARAQKAGTLHVAATPLGNGSDVTLRAIEVLRRAPIIAAEDTRVTKRLLQQHHIDDADKLILSCNDHNEAQRVDAVLSRLRAGYDVALVSDAGTPCISDPGSTLVEAAHNAGIRVTPVPGPSALAAALSVSGVQTAADHGGEGALFIGFLPRHGPARRRWMSAIASQHASRAVVLYEAPHRVVDTLRELVQWHGMLHTIRAAPPGGKRATMREVDGGSSASGGNVDPSNSVTLKDFDKSQRTVLVCRELTKKHEEVGRFSSLREALQAVSFASDAKALSLDDSVVEQQQQPLGEFTLVLYPMRMPPSPASGVTERDEMMNAADSIGHDQQLNNGGAEAPSLPPSSDDAQSDALAEAVELVAQLTAVGGSSGAKPGPVTAAGARKRRGSEAAPVPLSEAVTTAAAVCGVRRKALMLAVARAQLAAGTRRQQVAQA